MNRTSYRASWGLRAGIVAAPGAAALLLTLVFLGCASTIEIGTEYADAAPAPGPSFTSPDGGEPPVNVAMCVSYDCPEPYATCPGRAGLCNTNLDVDSDNCGACGNACSPDGGLQQGQSTSCVGGKCVLVCDPPKADCNGLTEDGCEADVTKDPANCGACGVACDAGDVCWYGACGCPPGYVQCAGTCTKLDSDPMNCSACGNVCNSPDADAGSDVWPCGPGVSPPSWGPICEGSSCTLDCQNGHANCNGDLCGDGCETDLAFDEKNCGACGHECGPSQGCFFGQCVCGGALAFCGSGNGEQPAGPPNACIDLMTDPRNCGACGRYCPGLADGFHPETGNPVCVLGKCSYYCPPGRADCNGRIEDGCEVDLTLDPLNCGACGAQCDLDAGQPCSYGKCLTKPCDVDAGGVF